MDQLLLFSLAAGVGLVFLLVVGKFALRCVIRLMIIGLVVLVAAGGFAWWWTSPRAQHGEAKAGSTPAKRTGPDRR